MENSKFYGQRATDIFKTGVCCSESIVHTFAELADPENAIKYTKMSSGLCGGMGYGSVCGVITGGSCAIGLFFGRNSLEETPEVKCSTISAEFVQAFQKQFGELGCKELKALTPASCNGDTRAFCTQIVEWGAEKVAEIIAQRESQR